MASLYMTTRNIRLLFPTNQVKGVSPDEVFAEIEVILGIVEKNYEFVGNGISAIDKLSTCRFTVGPDMARDLAKQLTEWAIEAEKREADTNGHLVLSGEKKSAKKGGQ